MNKFWKDLAHDLQYVLIGLNGLGLLASLFMLVSGVFSFGFRENLRAISLLSLLAEFFFLNARNAWRLLDRMDKVE